MDKSIVDKLVQFGLITNIDVDAEKYDSVDDLIAQGVITIPGIKNKILEIIGDEVESALEPINDTIVTDAPIIDEAPESEAEDEVPTSEIVVDEAPESEAEDETPEVESDTTDEDIEETSEESSKKSKKSKKN